MGTRGLVKSTILVTGITGIGLVLSFLSSVVTASKFGVGGEMDIYLSAISLPTFAITIIAGILASTFMPSFLEYEREGKTDLWVVVSGILNIYAGISLLICAVVILFPRPIMVLLAPGFNPLKIEKAAALLRLSIPTFFLSTINELAAGLFYSRRRFVLPSLTRVISPMLTILYVLFFAPTMSTRSLVFATLTATFIQTAVISLGLRTLDGFRYHFVLGFRHPAIRRIFRLALPLALTMPLYKAVPLFDRWIGSMLPEGSISTLGYATRLLNVIQPVLISGIAVSFFAIMAQQAADKDYREVRESMGKCIGMLLFCSIPIVALLSCFGRPVVRLLFERGSFLPRDTRATHIALSIYLLSLPWSLAGTIIGQGFYILKDTRTPALLGIAETIVYIVLCWFLVPMLGVYAVPVAYSSYFFLSVLVLLHFLSRRLGQDLFAFLWPPFAKQLIGAGAAIAGGVLFRLVLPDRRPFDMLPLALGFVVYFLVLKYALGSTEADRLHSLLESRLRRAKP